MEINSIYANVVGAEWNAQEMLGQLQQAIAYFSNNLYYVDECGAVITPPLGPVAAVRADVVGHSLGGLIGREMWYLPEFTHETNYDQGYIHKLITVGTPHLGSHDALKLMDGSSDCVRALSALTAGPLTGVPSFAFNTLTIDGTVVSGGAADLVGDGTFGGSSALIQQLAVQSTYALLGLSAPVLRMATVAGQASQSQFSAIDVFLSTGYTAGIALRKICPTDFLAINFTGTLWRNVFNGEDSDALVSVGSALNVPYPNTYDAANVLLSTIHGHGTVDDLGFGSPHLQEQLSGAPAKVITLLNTSVTCNVFSDVPTLTSK